MTNAAKFNEVFGVYATETWAMTESDFLLWLNREYSGAERKTGKWIDHSEDGYVECPLCGHLTTCDGNIEDLHYCFWCGTRLEVDE